MSADEGHRDDHRPLNGDDGEEPRAMHLVRQAIRSEEGQALKAEIQRIGSNMTEAVHELAGGMGHLTGEVSAVRQEMRDLRGDFDQLSSVVAPDPRAHHQRAMLPSLTEYNPDMTPAGGIRIEPHMWEALQRRIAAQEDAVRLSNARKQGADSASAALAEKSAKYRADVLFWMKVLGFTAPPLLVAATYIITHLAKL